MSGTNRTVGGGAHIKKPRTTVGSSIRWCVLGAGGQIGSTAVSVLAKDQDVLALSRAEVDITDFDSLRNRLMEYRPQVVLNAAAYTNVDACESNRELATRVNATAVGEVASICDELEAKLIHISTDYVFSGGKNTPYQEKDETHPLNFYGQTKLLGENLASSKNPRTWIVRTSWIYKSGFRNFPSVVIDKLRQGSDFQVVDDQVGAPTSASSLVSSLRQLVEVSPDFGVYHVTNSGQTSWYEFARLIAQSLKLDEILIKPVTSSEFARPALRPGFSVLDCGKWQRAGLPEPDSWQEAWLEAAPFFGASSRN